MNRRAQNPGEIFIYILTIVIVGIIFLFGYQSIRELMKRTDDVEAIQFQKRLESAVKSVSPEYGTVKRLSLPLSDDFNEVCVLRNDESITTDPFAGYPLIRDAYTANSIAGVYKGDNFFLLDQQKRIIEAYKVGITEVQEGLKCFPVDDGGVFMTLQGTGDSVKIS